MNGGRWIVALLMVGGCGSDKSDACAIATSAIGRYRAIPQSPRGELSDQLTQASILGEGSPVSDAATNALTVIAANDTAGLPPALDAVTRACD